MALLRASALSLSAAAPALQQPQGAAGGGASGRNSGARLVSTTAAAATTSSSGRGGAALSASVPAAAWYVKKGGNGSQWRSAGICCSQNQDVMQELDKSLETKGGVSLQALRDKLAAGEWEAADAETRRLLCVLAGEDAVKRKWVFFSEVQFISVTDFKLIDGLWRAYSNNKFGYSVQRKLWNNAGKNWNGFFKKVGWTRPLDDYQETYKKFPLEFMWDVADPTPEGHLPLTNALRGTRLLENILNHPAFADVDEQQKLRAEPDLLSGLFGSSPKSR